MGRQLFLTVATLIDLIDKTATLVSHRQRSAALLLQYITSTVGLSMRLLLSIAPDDLGLAAVFGTRIHVS